MRGGERVLDALAGLFPEADLYTLIHVPGATSERIERLRIVSSVLSRVPGSHRHYRKLLPLFPAAIERFRLDGYDAVLSTSHAVAKGVRTAPDTAHLCYCFTPMRYVWDQADAYLGRGARRAAAAPLVGYLRRFDRRTSSPERVTRFVAVSRTVAERIRRTYGREAEVVYPPVDLERIRPGARKSDDFYLMVGGFVPYKREEIAVRAFARTGRQLLVAGDGPGRARLARGAPDNVRFLGRVPDAELARLYARCRALVFTAEEDFGLVPVEAQAAGRPVVAFAAGGASESVVPVGRTPAEQATGVLFDAQTPDALVAALGRFESLEGRFDPRRIRRHAERFSAEAFRTGILRELAATRARARVLRRSADPTGAHPRRRIVADGA